MPWWQDAACFGYEPEWWFAEQGSERQTAILICNTCPVATECLDEVLELPYFKDQYGIRGGLTAKERKRLRFRRLLDSILHEQEHPVGDETSSEL